MIRILPPNSFPEVLWHESILRLPPALVGIYTAELGIRGAMDAALNGTIEKRIHGGADYDSTLKHFAHRYAVSAGRSEAAALGIHSHLIEVSNALLSTLSEGHVAILDVPCGSGCASGALLATLSLLRQERVLPILPLNLSIVGGDLSPSAMEIAESMIDSLRPTMEATGIAVQWNSKIWDATRGDHTAALINDWFDISAGADEYVVLVSNFSGALSDAGTLESFLPCFEQILARLHDKRSTVVWVEPSSSTNAEKLVKSLRKFLLNRIPWFSSAAILDKLASTTYMMIDPVTGQQFESNVQVERFVRR